MKVNKEKLAKKLTEYHKKPKISKKKEKKVRRKIQHLRRQLRERDRLIYARNDEWINEELERQRIIREVEEGQ